MKARMFKFEESHKLTVNVHSSPDSAYPTPVTSFTRQQHIKRKGRKEKCSTNRTERQHSTDRSFLSNMIGVSIFKILCIHSILAQAPTHLSHQSPISRLLCTSICLQRSYNIIDVAIYPTTIITNPLIILRMFITTRSNLAAKLSGGRA